MSYQADIAQALKAATGSGVRGLTPVAGGYIGDALRAELDDGRDLFIKTQSDAPAGTFATEAAGLEWLIEVAGTSVPGIVAVGDDAEQTGARFLALEWIEPGALTAAGAEQLGHGLACMHRAGAPDFGFAPGPRDAHGAYPPLRLGPHVTLPNDPRPTWAEFYAECRVRPLVAGLASSGQYDAAAVAAFDRLCARLPELAGPPELPARLHGDLWIGNVHAGADGHAYLIDPVAHGGHREFDIALLKLFGSPGERCFDAYAEIAPPAEGYAEREALWSIVPLLWHAVLLGGGYAEQALTTAKRYL